MKFWFMACSIALAATPLMGRRPGGKNSIDARQAESTVRALRPEQTADGLEKADGLERPLLRGRRQGRVMAHFAAVSQYRAAYTR